MKWIIQQKQKNVIDNCWLVQQLIIKKKFKITGSDYREH